MTQIIIKPAVWRCFSCGGGVTRNYWEFSASNFIDLEVCLASDGRVWSDGGISRDSDSENLYELETDQQVFELGDYIAKCPHCSALFIASLIPWGDHSSLFLDETRGWTDTSYNWDFNRYQMKEQEALKESLVVTSADIDSSSESMFLIKANLVETLRYLEELLSRDTFITWSIWTAAQQLVNNAVFKYRQGSYLTQLHQEQAMAALTEVARRVGQIMEGRPASLYPLMREENRGEEPPILQPDTIFLANLLRIVRPVSPDYYAGRFLPRKEFASEFNELSLQVLALHELIESNNADWEASILLQEILKKYFSFEWNELSSGGSFEVLSELDEIESPDLGDVLRGAKADWNRGPAIVFFVSRITEEVVLIAMVHPEDFSKAIRGAYVSDNQDEYWEPGNRSELESLLTADYSIWIFDWNLAGGDLGLDEYLSDQVLPVQMWATNQGPNLSDIEKVAEFIGLGSGYDYEEIIHYLGK